MRTSVLTLLILSLSTAPAKALTPGKGGGGPGPALLQVTNTCDEAVRLEGTSIFPPPVLEPHQSSLFYVNNQIERGSKGEMTITASLAADPSVTASETCTIQKGKTTTATISCTTTTSGVSLSIECDRPNKTAALVREAAVAMASGSGLGLLFLLGTLLGRTPRRRADETPVHVSPANS